VTDGEYDEFFRDAYPRLVAFGLAMSTPRQVAQDLAQETLIRAYERRDRLVELEAPYGWCRRVMSNLLIDQHRRTTAEQTAIGRLAHRSTIDRGGNGGSGPVEATDAWADMVAPLTGRQRCVATLFYADDRSVADIADDLGLSVGSVKTTLARIRRKVARHLEGIADHEETRT
jgi:RNA polymerase sigma-70 factor (ECF subfamily)